MANRKPNKIRKVIVAHSKGVYTAYTQADTLVGEVLYVGGKDTAESKAKEAARQHRVKVEHLNYPVIGKRRTLQDAVNDFAETNSMKVRKDLLAKALEMLGLTADNVAVIYHGPFAYVNQQIH